MRRNEYLNGLIQRLRLQLKRCAYNDPMRVGLVLLIGRLVSHRKPR